MKNILFLILLISIYSCKEADETVSNFKKLYSNNISDRYKIFNKLGEWEYSPNGKDSVWKQSDATKNLDLIETVLEELKPVEQEWDSLVFLSKKYDSIPLPNEITLKSLDKLVKRKSFVREMKIKVEAAINRGIYTRKGKKIK